MDSNLNLNLASYFLRVVNVWIWAERIIFQVQVSKRSVWETKIGTKESKKRPVEVLGGTEDLGAAWRHLGRSLNSIGGSWGGIGAILGGAGRILEGFHFGGAHERLERSQRSKRYQGTPGSPLPPPRKWSPGSSQAQFFHVFCSYFFDWQNDIFFSMLLIVWYFKSWIQCNFIRFSKGKYYVIRPSPTQVKIESQSMTNRNKLIKCRLSPGGAQEALKKCPQHPRPPRPRYVNPYQGAFWSTKKVKEE